MKKALIRTLGVLICLGVVAGFLALDMSGVTRLPDKIILARDETRLLNLTGMTMELTSDSVGVLKVNDETLSDKGYSASGPVELSTASPGEAGLSVKWLGIPVKTIAVSAVAERSLVPGGESIGVTLFTNGALIVGTSDITDGKGEPRNPAREAGLLPGDVIEAVNGVAIEDANHLSSIIADLNGDAVNVRARREGRSMDFRVIPVKDSFDGRYRLGTWVRDSTAGVGTLTYYDPANGTFAGLGHAITDVDTQKTLPVKNGDVIKSVIVDIDKGYSGQPGELMGSFSLGDARIGTISLNSEFGIYGTVNDGMESSFENSPLPVGYRDEVEYGPAQILTTIDQNGVRPYDCEIIKINDQSYPGQKGMVLRVTDSELLSRTGGIVQGMSGSPIIQNGKIIGAVTHVFLNSPEKGYGMFIEWMLENSDRCG